MILRAILFTLLLGGVLVTGTGAWVLAGVIDLQQDGVLLTLAGTTCYASACIASLYGLWQIARGGSA